MGEIVAFDLMRIRNFYQGTLRGLDGHINVLDLSWRVLLMRLVRF
jgi:hypothetical protein